MTTKLMTVAEASEQDLTDQGLADRFLALTGGNFLWCPDLYSSRGGQWFIWDPSRGVWREDRGKEAFAATLRVAELLEQELATKTDTAERKEWEKAVRSARMTSRRKAILEAAGAMATVKLSEFDADPWLLNFPNGVFDLKKLEFRPGPLRETYPALEVGQEPPEPGTYQPVRFLRCCSAPYDEAAEAPEWREFVNRIFLGDEEMIEFIHKAVGYSATGDTSEQALFMGVGYGANGKSTFIDTIAAALGVGPTGYAHKTPYETFLRKPSANGASPEIVDLAGARFVISDEAEEGRHLDEGALKELTGSATKTGRRLYGNPITFQNTAKLWLVSNTLPEIRGTDDGIYRRLRVIKFDYRIPPEEQDRNIQQKLLRELPGILAWIVEGAIKWKISAEINNGHGLGQPEAVARAVSEYRASQDVITMFISDCLDVVTDDRSVKTASSELWKVFRAWADENGVQWKSAHKFYTRIKARFEVVGIKPERDRSGMHYPGVVIREDARRLLSPFAPF